MGRSGYSEDWDGDNWDIIRWRGAVNSSIKGKRGQAFLKELAAALDNMPEKKLIEDDLIRSDGSVCALGSVGKARNLDMSEIDPEDPDTVAGKFGIASALVKEIEFINDEWNYNATPERRWQIVREWVTSQII